MEDVQSTSLRCEAAKTNLEVASIVRLAVLRAARRLRTQRVNTIMGLSQLSAVATAAKCGPMSAREIAVAEGVQPPSLTKILASLENGLIARSLRPGDRRQSTIAISHAGQQLLRDDNRVRDEWLARQLAQLTDSDRCKLVEVAEVLERLSL
jgi:DNA-binding MarR family transcriptional regulator